MIANTTTTHGTGWYTNAASLGTGSGMVTVTLTWNEYHEVQVRRLERALVPLRRAAQNFADQLGAIFGMRGLEEARRALSEIAVRPWPCALATSHKSPPVLPAFAVAPLRRLEPAARPAFLFSGAAFARANASAPGTLTSVSVTMTCMS